MNEKIKTQLLKEYFNQKEIYDEIIDLSEQFEATNDEIQFFKNQWKNFINKLIKKYNISIDKLNNLIN